MGYDSGPEDPEAGGKVEPPPASKRIFKRDLGQERILHLVRTISALQCMLWASAWWGIARDPVADGSRVMNGQLIGHPVCRSNPTRLSNQTAFAAAAVQRGIIGCAP